MNLRKCWIIWLVTGSFWFAYKDDYRPSRVLRGLSPLVRVLGPYMAFDLGSCITDLHKTILSDKTNSRSLVVQAHFSGQVKNTCRPVVNYLPKVNSETIIGDFESRWSELCSTPNMVNLPQMWICAVLSVWGHMTTHRPRRIKGSQINLSHAKKSNSTKDPRKNKSY